MDYVRATVDVHQKGETMDRIKVERAFAGLTEWQKHVQTNSDIDRDISTAIEALKAQLFYEDATSDLIDRQAAIDLVKDVCDAIMSGCESWYDPETGDEVYKDIREVDAILKCNKEVKIALRNMSPAQPEPKEGEWINTNPEYKNGFYNNSYYCSECHDYYTTSPYEMKFCPNCGARMKGET